ncbi:MAG: hypothetical protein JWM47_3783 [Acidimicrobiales bacterium]|nr:hypothetical protein [Acidimicrobiales bacterium]
MGTLSSQLAEPSKRDALASDGWCVVDGLAPEPVAAAFAELSELGPATDDAGVTRFDSACSLDPAYRAAAADVAERLLRPLLGDVVAHDASYVIVWPGPSTGQGVGPARPDVAASTGLLVEVSLDGAYDWSGETWVVPGSHRRPVSDGGAWGAQGGPPEPEVLARDHARPVPLDPGQALVCHPRLVRFCLPNDGRPQRLLTALVAVPAPAAPGHVPAGPDGRGPSAVSPAGPPLGPEVCARCGLILDADPVDRWSAREVRRCPPCARRPVAGVPQPPRVEVPLVVPPDALPESPAPVLRDPRLDDLLRRHGFVVVPEPIISPAAAHQLRERFGELHRWRGVGHLNDFNHRDHEYRRRATALMMDVLGPAVDTVFVDHQAFLSTFLCKWPGEDSELEPHQDWMYVDESSGERTFAAFVALNAIDGHNGQLRMLRASHRLDPMARGTDLRAPWLAHLEVIERRFESLPLQVGQCAVWNSAMVHASYPNLTDEPRVAASLWMARRGVPLTHYRRTDRATATWYEIDEDFYRTQDPFRLMVAEPPYVARGRVALLDRYATADELDAALERAKPSRADALVARARATLRRW